ncbi:MAG: OmpA family protein [Saprospiraceae bacterium]|nr:OmpA family protein [Saprospiraceae bacterium]
MMNSFFSRLSSALTIAFLFFFLSENFAQKAGLEVTRSSAVDRALPVLNVAIDAEGRKWAANSKGVFQVKAADLSTARTLAAGEKSVLAYRGGNADFTWSDADFKKIAGEDCEVTAAWYDAASATLWLGTDISGLYQLKTTPQLQMVQQYKTVNSKLKSNNITVIFQDKTNRLWVGTDDGLMYGTPGRWKSDFSGYTVQRIREYGTVTYVLADGEISKAPNGDKWSDLALDKKNLEGQIADFDIDAMGKMWIVSGMLTRFDLLDNTYTTFSGPEYYTSQYGTCMAIDNESAVWVGTEDKGLYIVDKASSMTVNFLIEQPISCGGNGKDAVLRLKITGGVAPYKIDWTGGLSGENPHNVPAGNYTATVTDVKGKSRTIQVPVPDARLRIVARQRKAITGPGKSDAVAEVDIDGNASGLQITWDNGETLATATKLSAGEHTVTVTDPKGCTITAKVTITEKIAPLSIAITETSSIKCAGDKTAAVAVQVTGGKAPYKYQWNNPALSGETPGALAAGGYQVTVTDAAGTTAFAAVVVPQPEPFALIALGQSPATPGSTDGKALAQATGGVTPQSFKWDNGETTAVASKLTAGQHSVTATNPSGCIATASVRIMENIQPLGILISEKTSIKCFGEKNAALSVQVTGGKGPFKYQWSSPSINGDQPVGVAAGDYQLTVTDALNVTSIAAVTVKQPDRLTLTVTILAPASTGNKDGKAQAQPQGGAGSYIFEWQSGESSSLASRLAPSNNGVTVTDANGCTASTTVSISEDIQPLSVSISEQAKIKCAGDKTAALTVQVNGGKGPFKYKWNNPALTGDQPTALSVGDYLVTVTDAAGNSSTASFNVPQPQPLIANAAIQAPASSNNEDGKALAKAIGGTGAPSFKWDNGETTALATKLAPGEHSVLVTDANGCVATTAITISENILPLTVSIVEKTKIKCSGDRTAALAVEISGGKSPFNYLWNNPLLSGDQPTGLLAGDYLVTVTDAAGTTRTASYSVVQPQPLTLTADVEAPASTGNSDGKALAQVTGGAGTPTFKWDNGETTATAVKLPPGLHTVTATDANGCFKSVGVLISENIQPLAVRISEKTAIKCAGEKSALNVQVSGGKSPFTFSWNVPALSGGQPAGLDGGAYSVTVTDANGTSQAAAIEVKSPTPLEVTLIRNIGATTERSNDGKAELTVKGGTPKYTILWDTKQTGLSAPKLPLGKHSVSVTDANGCAQKIDFETEKRILPELTGNLESGQTIRMRLLNFDSDSTSLKSESLPMLDELYDFMSENGTVVIEIGGHTNNVPPDEFADKLSTGRAKTVADYLFAKGIDPKRVVYKGYGKRLPLVPNTSPEGRRTNQRVEIKILRLKD